MRNLEEIKNTYPVLYARIEELRDTEIELSDKIHCLFPFDKTAEGIEFWWFVNNGDFEPAKELQPQLFKWIPKIGEQYFRVIRGSVRALDRHRGANGLPDDYYIERDVYQTKELALASLEKESPEHGRVDLGSEYWFIKNGDLAANYDLRLEASNARYKQGNYYKSKKDASLTLISLKPKEGPMRSQPFIPEKGQRYYYVSGGRLAVENIYNGGGLSLGVTLYRTRDEALEALKPTREEAKPDWRAEEFGCYWFVDYKRSYGASQIVETEDWGNALDNSRYECGNYFQTEKLALAAIEEHIKTHGIQLFSTTHKQVLLDLKAKFMKPEEDKKDRFAVPQGIQKGIDDHFCHIFDDEDRPKEKGIVTKVGTIEGDKDFIVLKDWAFNFKDGSTNTGSARGPRREFTPIAGYSLDELFTIRKRYDAGYRDSDGPIPPKEAEPVKVYSSSLFTDTSPLVGLPAIQQRGCK